MSTSSPTLLRLGPGGDYVSDFHESPRRAGLIQVLRRGFRGWMTRVETAPLQYETQQMSHAETIGLLQIAQQLIGTQRDLLGQAQETLGRLNATTSTQPVSRNATGY